MAICNNCGASLRDDEPYCNSCGAKNDHYGTNWENQAFRGEQWYSDGQYHPQPTQQMSGLAVASLVFGIITWVLGWFTFGVPAILGIVFGVLGMSQCKRKGLPERGLAVAGLILSVIYLVLAVVFFSFVIQFATALVETFGGMLGVLHDMPSTGYFY